MKNKAQVFILCEDSVHYHFSRKYLELLGFDNRKIRGKFNPKGRSMGSGAKYVEDNYANEVKAFRSKDSFLASILVVVIDDDTHELINNLYRIEKPSANERILIFSPKRNIESWFHYIDGHTVDESKDYKNQYRNTKPTGFAKKLKNNICQNGLPETAPSSLHHACDELKRLNH